MMMLTKTKEYSMPMMMTLYLLKKLVVTVLFVLQSTKVMVYVMILHGGQDRPKPNPKYSPEVYDLSYVGVRKRSRKSIRRADR